jgi:hypothetical protein
MITFLFGIMVRTAQDPLGSQEGIIPFPQQETKLIKGKTERHKKNRLSFLGGLFFFPQSEVSCYFWQVVGEIIFFFLRVRTLSLEPFPQEFVTMLNRTSDVFRVFHSFSSISIATCRIVLFLYVTHQLKCRTYKNLAV